MRIAIHQPHYFPWLGYLDKMAKVDQFVLMDDVQLTDKSNMFRNKFLSKSGNEKYLTVCFKKQGYMGKPFKEVELNPQVNWQQDHMNFIRDNYLKAPFFDEIWDEIGVIFEKHYNFLCNVAIDSLSIMKNLYGIHTRLISQSELDYDHNAKKE